MHEVTVEWLLEVGFNNCKIDVFEVKPAYEGHETRVFIYGVPIPTKNPWTQMSLIEFFQSLGYFTEYRIL